MSAYPEHEKLAALKGANRVIGEFLEWVSAHPSLCLGQWREHDDDGEPLRNPRLMPFASSIPKLLAEYFGINEAKLETEKRAMLAGIRRATR